jgi:hypothetical protein
MYLSLRQQNQTLSKKPGSTLLEPDDVGSAQRGSTGEKHSFRMIQIAIKLQFVKLFWCERRRTLDCGRGVGREI